MPEDTSPTIERLEDQIGYYDRSSIKCQKIYKRLRNGELIAAAIIPFVAGLEYGPYIAGALGVLVVILAGLERNGQYHHNWQSYRTTCEELKHEKYLYLAGAGPYEGCEFPERLLASRIEMLISQEHSNWVASRRQGEATATAQGTDQ